MLTDILQLDIFRFMLIFSRLGTAMMLLPGIGGTLVSARIRMWLAICLSYLMLPVLAPHLPTTPPHLAALLQLVFAEVVVGAFMGTVVSLIMSTLGLAGTMIGYQVGLTNAFSFDPIAQQQNQLLTGFLSNIGLLAVFGADLHHQMFLAIVESYDLFHPGLVPAFGEIAETLSHLVTDTFRLGLQFAAPLVVFGLVFYAGLGLISRLVPSLQVFFVAVPVQLVIGMWMFMATLPMLIILFLRFFETALTPYLVPR